MLPRWRHGIDALVLPLLALLFTALSPTTDAYDPCGPIDPPQNDSYVDSCFLNSTWSGGGAMNGMMEQQESYFNYTQGIVNAPVPINPVDCQFVIPVVCGLLADHGANLQRDIWHWNELGSCRVGMFVPGRPGAAPLADVDKCQWRIFYQMLADTANWGYPKAYYGSTTFGQVNLAFINIRLMQAGLPKNDTVQHAFPQTENGLFFDDGYPAYILEYPSKN